MAILTIQEILDIILMTIFMGYIFSGFFKIPKKRTYDPLVEYYQKAKGFISDDFKYAALITAPAIILHELGHKFVAIAFGAQAQFHAAYSFLILGALLKALNFGFIFFVPAYVSHTGVMYPWQSSLIAFAGPGVNLLLWLCSHFYLKYSKIQNRTWKAVLFATSRINMFLFILNMIPLSLGPFSFDGWQVFKGLFQTFL